MGDLRQLSPVILIIGAALACALLSLATTFCNFEGLKDLELRYFPKGGQANTKLLPRYHLKG